MTFASKEVIALLTAGDFGNAAMQIKDAGFSEDASLVKAAEDAVRQWRYQPLTLDGKPAEMDSPADVVFAVKNLNWVLNPDQSQLPDKCF